MSDLSIILVNWNTRDVLLDCLGSIQENPPDRPWDVWLVDNGSVDGSAEAVQQQHPWVNLIVNPTKVGFAAANNQAIAASTGRYVLMLNVDTLILPGALEAMCAYMDAHPEAGAVGCRLLNADGTTQRSAWLGYPGLRSAAIEGFYLWRLFPSMVTRSEVSLANPTTPQVVDHLLGACIVVPRRVIDQVGALDPVYPLYFEETDWCLRIQRGGWQVVYLPDSSIVHLGQQTQYLYPGPTLPMYYTSFCHYMRKYGGRWPKLQLLLLKTIIAVSIILRLGLWSLRMVRQQTLSRRMLGGYSRVLRQLPSM